MVTNSHCTRVISSRSLQQSLPYGEGISPLLISDEEELERLASLQLRDSLVRGLGVSEQLQVTLEQTGSTSRPPSTMAPPPPPMFFTHVVRRDLREDSTAGVAASHSSSSLLSDNNILTSVTNSTETTPQHSLPGAGPPNVARQLGGGVHSKSQNLFRLNRQSNSYSYGSGQTQASVNSLSAAYHRPPYAFGSTVK